MDQPLTKKQRRELRKQEQRDGNNRLHQQQALKQWGVRFLVAVVLAGAIYGLWWLSQQAVVTVPAGTELTITDKDWIKGNKDAPVTLVEFSDFQCPACGAYFPIITQLSQAFPDQLRIIYRNFPLTSIHPNAMAAAQAAEAAGLQGKFWEMHDLLFQNQTAWSNLADPRPTFEQYAQQLTLNVDQFKQDVSGDAVAAKISIDKATVNQLGINSTPTFFINGKLISNPTSLDEFKGVVQAALPVVQ